MPEVLESGNQLAWGLPAGRPIALRDPADRARSRVRRERVHLRHFELISDPFHVAGGNHRISHRRFRHRRRQRRRCGRGGAFALRDVGAAPRGSSRTLHPTPWSPRRTRDSPDEFLSASCRLSRQGMCPCLISAQAPPAAAGSMGCAGADLEQGARPSCLYGPRRQYECTSYESCRLGVSILLSLPASPRKHQPHLL